MSDNPYAVRRAAFMESAGEAFDRMFDANEQHQLITFTQREDRMLELGRKLQIELLQAHLQADPLARPEPGGRVCCPDCGQAGREDSGQARKLKTRGGETQWKRSVYYCKRCRRSFSPSGQRVGTRP